MDDGTGRTVSSEESERELRKAYRRKMGRSFFYHHEACVEEAVKKREQAYTQVPLGAIAPGTVCYGCWKPLHDVPEKASEAQ